MRRFGSLDEFAAARGQHLGYSEWHPVPQAQIGQFADATGDRQWIHVDPARAAAGPFGTTVAHGFLTLSLLSQLFTAAVAFEDVRLSINYGLNRVRFPSPVPVGSRLRALCVLDTFEPIAGGAQLTVTITIEREGDAKPACVAEWVTRHFT